MVSTVHSSNRTLVVGGGIAGLSTAVRLAKSGHAVTVLERTRQLGAGATTRNQGWLHSGALFAVNHPGIAKLCYEGLRETLRFCPECVEPGHDGAMFLLSDTGFDPQRWLRAWGEVGIPYRPISPPQMLERLPGVARSEIRKAFLLPDRSIRTDVLLRRLAVTAEQAGVEFRPATEVVRLLRVRNEVHGVVTQLGEEITGKLVVLAANTWNTALLPELQSGVTDEDRGGCAVVALKTHLIATEPAQTVWPLCMPDYDGFNHLPHPPSSIWGTNRWSQATDPADERPASEEFELIRGHLARLFPERRTEIRETAAWAGTTVQAVPGGRDLPTEIAWPAVIDQAREPQPVQGVVSIFPGRATLWTRLADEALRVILGKLATVPLPIASPPWAAGDSDAPGTGSEQVNLYHCQKCGRLERRKPGLQTPVCCGVVMEKAAEVPFASGIEDSMARERDQ